MADINGDSPNEPWPWWDGGGVVGGDKDMADLVKYLAQNNPDLASIIARASVGGGRVLSDSKLDKSQSLFRNHANKRYGEYSKN